MAYIWPFQQYWLHMTLPDYIVVVIEQFLEHETLDIEGARYICLVMHTVTKYICHSLRSTLVSTGSGWVNE